MIERVLVRKWDGRRHYQWSTQCFGTSPELIWVGKFGPRDLRHWSKHAIFTFATTAMEWFHPDLPCSIGCSWKPGMQGAGFYCNIHLPLTLQDHTIEFIDLDIDVVRDRHGHFTCIDIDEFHEHAELFSYPTAIREQVPAIGDYLVEHLTKSDVFAPAHIADMLQSFRAGEADGATLWANQADIFARELTAFAHKLQSENILLEIP